MTNRGLVAVTRDGLRALLGFPDGALVVGVSWDAVHDHLLVAVDHPTMPRHVEGWPLQKVAPPLPSIEGVEFVTLTEAKR